MAISEQSGIITYKNEFPVWARIFVGLIGLVMAIVAPAMMISIASSLWTWSFALSVFTGVALSVFGVFAVVVSLSSVMTLEFRLSERVLVVSTRGPVTRSRKEYDFAGVGGPSFAMRDSEDGAYPVLGLSVHGKKSKLEMAGFADADEARLWQRRITDMLAASA